MGKSLRKTEARTRGEERKCRELALKTKDRIGGPATDFGLEGEFHDQKKKRKKPFLRGRGESWLIR